MSIPNLRISPTTAFQMLLLFLQKRVELTHDELDAYQDRVIQVLEDLNNERYRAANSEELP